MNLLIWCKVGWGGASDLRHKKNVSPGVHILIIVTLASVIRVLVNMMQTLSFNLDYGKGRTWKTSLNPCPPSNAVRSGPVNTAHTCLSFGKSEI